MLQFFGAVVDYLRIFHSQKYTSITFPYCWAEIAPRAVFLKIYALQHYLSILFPLLQSEFSFKVVRNFITEELHITIFEASIILSILFGLLSLPQPLRRYPMRLLVDRYSLVIFLRMILRSCSQVVLPWSPHVPVPRWVVV